MHPLVKGLLFLAGNIVLVILDSGRQRKLNAQNEQAVKTLIERMESSHDDPQAWFSSVLVDHPRTKWAGRWWYKAKMRINGVDCDLICPTSEGLTTRHLAERTVSQVRWSDVRDVTHFL